MENKTEETQKKSGRPTNATMIKDLKEENKKLLKTNTEALKSNEELSGKFDKLEAMFEQAMQKQSAPPVVLEQVSVPQQQLQNDKIALDEYIKVISLCPHNLNLSRHRGDNQPKTFRGFGDSKKILYKDLVNIMDHHVNFRDEGLFYAADERVIRQHGLNDLYSTLLTEQTIRSMVNGKNENLEEVFRAANDSQRKIITDMIVERIVAGRDIDLNMIDRLERVISSIARKRLEETINNNEEITPDAVKSAEAKLGGKMHQRAKDIKYYTELPA